MAVSVFPLCISFVCPDFFPNVEIEVWFHLSFPLSLSLVLCLPIALEDESSVLVLFRESLWHATTFPSGRG